MLQTLVDVAYTSFQTSFHHYLMNVMENFAIERSHDVEETPNKEITQKI
jgi:hypothetical protein